MKDRFPTVTFVKRCGVLRRIPLPEILLEKTLCERGGGHLETALAKEKYQNNTPKNITNKI